MSFGVRRAPPASGSRSGTTAPRWPISARPEQSGQTWRKVRDPDGNVGWTAGEFLVDPARAATTARQGPGTAATAAAVRIGGLGLSRAEWEKAHGQPSRSSIFLEYDGGRLVVGLLESNVWHIERVWMRNEAVSLDAARDDARAYLPSDANLTQSVDRGDGRIIDIYTSTISPAASAPTAWNGGKAGTFSIKYKFRAPDRSDGGVRDVPPGATPASSGAPAGAGPHDRAWRPRIGRRQRFASARPDAGNPPDRRRIGHRPPEACPGREQRPDPGPQSDRLPQAVLS